MHIGSEQKSTYLGAHGQQRSHITQRRILTMFRSERNGLQHRVPGELNDYQPEFFYSLPEFRQRITGILQKTPPN